MFTMNDLFDIAIKMENNGERTYRKAVSHTRHKDLKDLLRWMAAEETRHALWFADRKEKLALDKEERHLREMVPTKALEKMMGSKTLDLEEVEFKSLSTVSELMETFIHFEKETILFYELLEMFIEDNVVKEGLLSIIAEEQKHVEKLLAMTQELKETSL